MKVKNNYSFETYDDVQGAEIGERHLSFNLLNIRSTVIVIDV